MKNTTFLLIFLLFPFLLQCHNIDSLSVVYDSGKPSESLKAAQAIQTICYENGSSDSLYSINGRMSRDEQDAIILSPLSDYFYGIHRYQDASNIGKRGAIASKRVNNLEMEGLCYSTLAACGQHLGNFEDAIYYARLCYELDEKLGDKANMSSSLNNLAVISLSTQHAADAKEFIDKALEIERTLNRKDVLAIRLGVAAETYMTLGNFDEALKFATEALELNQQTGNQARAAIRMCQIAAVYQNKGELDRAEKMYLAAIKALEDSGNMRSLSICYNSLASLAINKKEFTIAEYYLLKAINAAEISGYSLQRLKAYTSMANMLKNIRPKDAVKYYELKEQLRDSLFNDESEKQINNFNIQYQTREKEHQIELQQLRIERQKGSQFMMAVIIILFAVSFVVLARLIHLQKKRNRELSEMNAVKNKFFSIISHDLKNPVIAQKMSLEMIVNNFDNIPKEILQKQCVELMDNTSTLLNLLYNLLNWSRIELDRMPIVMVRFDLRTIYNEVESVLYPQLQNKQLKLSFDVEKPVFVMADRNMVTIVLRNIVSNAIKFSQLDSKIEVSAQLNDKFWSISVKDFGVGMSADKIATLFSLKSQQTSVGTAGEQGTGLGLVICREMVERNGGKISVTSREGEGTVMTFTLKSDE